MKNDPRIKQNMEAAAPLSEESEGMLAAMRHVVTKPASKDTTFEQREYRKWLNQDRKGFMTKKADLEKAALQGQAKGEAGRLSPAKVPEALPDDEAQMRVEDLIQKMLDETTGAADAVGDPGDG